MKRHIAFFIALLLSAHIMSETYTIVFNSGDGNSDSTSPKTALSDIVLSSTYGCASNISTANKIYRAKAGFGIKGGTGSAKGELTIELNATYAVTSMRVYAAPFAADSSKGNFLNVCGQTITWANGHKNEIYPYQLTLNQDLQSIAITVQNAKNNRWYIQKIEFDAEDPMPTHAKLDIPMIIDLGTVNTYEDELPAEDVYNIDICGKDVSSPIALSMSQGTYFSVFPPSLPANGGEANIAYSINFSGYTTIHDTLIVECTGEDHLPLMGKVPIKINTYIPTDPSTNVNIDSSGMAIGPMPGNYYAIAQGAQDSALKSLLGEIIHCGVRYKYGSGNRKTWDGFYYTDRDTNTNQVLDMYSDHIRYFNPEKPTASVAEFDIEHMLPKSWWGGDVNPAYCDLYHLVPGDYSANRSKSNHAPGIPSDTTFWNGSFATGSGAAYGLQKVFCPADEYKGDFARAYFYIATCYGDSLQWVESGEPGMAMTNDSWQEFRPWLRDLLLQWHRSDPVSQKELDRAIQVNKIQGNRNPFIDYPELVEYIWGNKQGTAVDFYLLQQSYGNEYDDTMTAIDRSQAHSGTARKELRKGKIIIIFQNSAIYDVTGQSIQ